MSKTKLRNLMNVKKEKVEEWKPSFVDRIRAFDLLEVMKQDMGTAYIIPPHTGKITEIEALKTTKWEGVWIYTNPDRERFCNRYQSTVEHMNYIPPKCMACWKVVVRPKTLLQLFMLYDLQVKMIEGEPGCFCKCGVEVREWVFGNYGGYFYTNSKEEGLARYKQVRELVDEQISPDIDIVLKRSCTEFEQKYGPSDEWDKMFDPETHPIIAGWEKLIEENVVATKTDAKQPEIVRKHIMNYWVDFAYDRGDPTVIKLNDGKPLYPTLVTYHKPILQGVKKNVKESK